MDSPPCVWPLGFCGSTAAEDTGEDPVCSHLAGLDDVTLGMVVGAAVGYLWNVTGRKYGVCPTSVRPCGDDCAGSRRYAGWGWGGLTGSGWWVGPYSGLLNPMIWGGEWINLVCGTCADTCGHSNLSTIRLPGPVSEILEVRVDGAILPPTDYRQDNLGLVRLGGESWPKFQDMSADPLTDPDTFLVTYMRGRAVPPGGQLAAGVLACEMAKMICGDKSCKLPKRVTSINREGVTIDMIDSFSQMWTRGSTGLSIVDFWIASERIGQRAGVQIASPTRRPFRNGPLS